MIDLNNILTQALTAAVAEALLPLQQEYANKMGEMAEKIAALEIRLTEAQLFQKTTEVTVPINEARLVEVLDQQEWFWEKLTRKAGEAAESAVEEAINDHCTTYDHDDYDSVSSTVNDVDFDEIVTVDNLRSEIKDVFRNASVSIDV